MRFSIIVAILCASLLARTAVFAEPMTAQDVFSKSEPSIVLLNVTAKDGKNYVGSGFIAFKDGLAVTAWHVVHDAKAVTAKFADGQEFDVTGLVDKDEKRDIALVKIKVFGRTPLNLAAAPPPVGSKAFAIGAPESLSFSISDGLVSQIRQVSGVNVYQFTSPISPGNSGGPVLNDTGQVIGVVSFQFTEGQNLNFAIPSTYVLALDPTLPTVTWDKVVDTNVADSGTDKSSGSTSEGAQTSTPSTIAGKSIEDVNQFFDDFMFDKTPPAKSPFETKDEYAKRTVHRLKPGQTYYFLIDRGKNPSPYDKANFDISAGRNDSGYDMDSGKLTLFAGAFQTDFMAENSSHGTVPVAIDRIVKKTGEYDGSNSYGAHATVTQLDKSGHILDIKNHRDFKGKVDFRDRRMTIMTVLKDRDKAKVLDQRGEVVLGVHFDQYDDGHVSDTNTKATYSYPYEEHAVFDYLEVTLDSVLVVDPTTDTVTVEYDDKQ